MALTNDESDLLQRLTKSLRGRATDYDLNDAYYEGEQRLVQLGLAVPPDLQRFVTIVNWPRIVVDAIEERCDVKSFIRGGDNTANQELRDIWDGNNLDSEFHLAALDSLVHGVGFLSVGANEDDPTTPIVLVESPTEMTVDIDPRRRRVMSALKLYGYEGRVTPRFGTLYTPTETIWLEKDGNRWDEVDRDTHALGRVPIIPFFNRRRSGRPFGVSEMADAFALTDAAARSLTNLQVASETHAVPQRWVTSMSKGDFADPATGAPLPVWQAYFGAIWATEKADAKMGQFSASDLRNFHETVNHYATLVAGLYGLPMRYLGQNTANPPSADGIRADEARLVKRAERKMSSWGDQLGRTMAYALRFKNKAWLESGDRIKVEWHDAATPTYAARVDGIQKLTGGQPILSREGGWDELGWSDARKDRERTYFEAQDADPVLERVTRDLIDVAATSGG